MIKYHNVRDVQFKNNAFFIIIDGERKSFPLKKVSTRLLQASESDRSEFEISPSGYGIHWPTIDEDVSIDGLFGVVHQ